MVTTEYELFYDNLPEAFDGYRIVVISDLHAARYGENNSHLVASVRNAQPDVIVITGDLIDRFQTIKPVAAQLEIADTLVGQLTPIAHVYYITGNHEWDSGVIEELFAILESHGVRILRNEYTLIEPAGADGTAIILAGIDDPNGPANMIKPQNLVENIFAAEGECFTIVLVHRNHHLPLFSELGVDLVLCGHAHGGIVRLPFTDGLIGPRIELFPTYTSGVYSMGGTNMVVSRGLGNHLGWTRFLNNPQLVVVELRRA